MSCVRPRKQTNVGFFQGWGGCLYLHAVDGFDSRGGGNKAIAGLLPPGNRMTELMKAYTPEQLVTILDFVEKTRTGLENETMRLREQRHGAD